MNDLITISELADYESFLTQYLDNDLAKLAIHSVYRVVVADEGSYERLRQSDVEKWLTEKTLLSNKRAMVFVGHGIRSRTITYS